MTTTCVRWSSSRPALLLLALLATLVLVGPIAPVAAEGVGDNGGVQATPLPEPATLLFVSAAGLALFWRRTRQRVR